MAPVGERIATVSATVGRIAGFVASHVGLNTNLATIEKEIAEAEKAAREEAKKKHKVVGNGGKKGGDSAAATQPLTASRSEPTAPQMLSLFDQQSQPDASEPLEAAQQTAVNPQ